MADVSDQQGDESFVVEPIQPLDGTPAPSVGHTQPPRWLQKQRLPGLIALAEGLALLGFFWLAPWFSWQVFYIGDLHLTQILLKRMRYLVALHNYPGWAAAQGISIPDIDSTAYKVVFASLWLIPLAAAALLLVAWLRWRGRLSDRQTLVTLLAFSAVALLSELGFFLQVHNLQVTFGPTFDTSVSWGFWGAVGVTAAAIDAGITLLKFARFRAHTAHAQEHWRVAAAES